MLYRQAITPIREDSSPEFPSCFSDPNQTVSGKTRSNQYSNIKQSKI